MNDHATDEYGVLTAPRTLRIERTLPGPIERVWAYLTEPGERRTWLAGGPMELREGGTMELVFHNVELQRDADDVPPPKHAANAGKIRSPGRVTVCEPPRRLGFTWDEGDGTHSQVLFDLTRHGPDVRLVLTHGALASRAMLVGVAGGWHTHLGVLAARLADAPLPPFWSTVDRLESDYEARIPADA